MIKTYRKVGTVDGIQWDGTIGNLEEIYKFTKGQAEFTKDGDVFTLVIKTIEGDMRANVGDYILKGIEGECWPVKESIFLKTYEEV